MACHAAGMAIGMSLAGSRGSPLGGVAPPVAVEDLMQARHVLGRSGAASPRPSRSAFIPSSPMPCMFGACGGGSRHAAPHAACPLLTPGAQRVAEHPIRGSSDLQGVP